MKKIVVSAGEICQFYSKTSSNIELDDLVEYSTRTKSFNLAYKADITNRRFLRNSGLGSNKMSGMVLLN